MYAAGAENSSPIIEDETRLNLCLVLSPAGLLFGMKTRGFGKGKLVLPGGKAKLAGPNFSGRRQDVVDIQEELFEETGLSLPAAAFEGLGYLFIEDEEDETRNVLVAKATLPHTPELRGSGELENLQWHPLDALPYDQTPYDYQLWMPSALSGYLITAFLKNIETDFSGTKVYRQQIEPLGLLEQVH